MPRNETAELARPSMIVLSASAYSGTEPSKWKPQPIPGLNGPLYAKFWNSGFSLPPRAGNMIEAMAGTQGSGGSDAIMGPVMGTGPGMMTCIFRISGEPTSSELFGCCLSDT